jgi:hypothetical protein
MGGRGDCLPESCDKVAAIGNIDVMGAGFDARQGDAVVLPLKRAGTVNHELWFQVPQSIGETRCRAVECGVTD